MDEIVARAQLGDKEALTWLYEQFNSKIIAYYYHRTPNWMLAEDLAHDCWVRIFTQLHRYTKQGSIPFSGWLYRIAHNILIDYYRASKGTVALSIEEYAFVTDLDRQFEDPKTVQSDDQAMGMDVQLALSHLTGKQHEVVECRFIKGLSILETSHRMDVSEDAVKKLQARGLHHIRRELGWNTYHG